MYLKPTVQILTWTYLQLLVCVMIVPIIYLFIYLYFLQIWNQKNTVK